MHIQQTQELSVVVVVSFFSLSLSLSLSAAVSVHATPHTRKAQRTSKRATYYGSRERLHERKLVFTDEIHPDIISEAVYFSS
jgi:hypothetical protein